VLNRQGMSADDSCSTTLTDYLKFDSEMSVVSAVWKECRRLIEAYNEQQVGHDCSHCVFTSYVSGG